MKRKTIQRRFRPDRKHPDGKYLGLFKQEKRSWSSAGSTIETTLRDFFEAPRATIAETIDQYESNALAFIEAEGYEVKKPYRFGDSYTHDQGWATLSGLIEMHIGTDEWSLTPLGCAAQILTDCHNLQQSMESGNLEKTAHSAMLLQQSVDYLNFMQWEYPARAGEKAIIGRQHGSDKSAQTRKRDLAARNKKIIKDFKAGIPTVTIAERQEVSQRTVQELVKPYR